MKAASCQPLAASYEQIQTLQFVFKHKICTLKKQLSFFVS